MQCFCCDKEIPDGTNPPYCAECDGGAGPVAKPSPITRLGSGFRPGTLSNAAITARNGGVQHQFIDDIGGCSANYR